MSVYIYIIYIIYLYIIHVSLSVFINTVYTYFPPGEKNIFKSATRFLDYVSSQEGNVLKACESISCSNCKCVRKVFRYPNMVQVLCPSCLKGRR